MYDQEHHALTRRESVRIPLQLIRDEAVDPAILNSPSTLEELVPGWRYAGALGAKRDLAYARTSRFRLRTRAWPLLTENVIELDVLRPRGLRARLVPRDQSTVVLRTPRRLIYETDPDKESRVFGDTDIHTVTLAGLEDAPEMRQITLRVANEAAQTWLYDGLRTLTGWAIMKWLFLAVAGAVTAFFVERFLKGRFPDPPAARRLEAPA